MILKELNHFDSKSHLSCMSLVRYSAKVQHCTGVFTSTQADIDDLFVKGKKSEILSFTFYVRSSLSWIQSETCGHIARGAKGLGNVGICQEPQTCQRLSAPAGLDLYCPTPGTCIIHSAHFNPERFGGLGTGKKKSCTMKEHWWVKLNIFQVEIGAAFAL